MMPSAMTDDESTPPQRPNEESTPRPQPAPNSPFAPPPERPAVPEYDEKGITPDNVETR
jgi:hypothetical protein